MEKQKSKLPEAIRELFDEELQRYQRELSLQTNGEISISSIGDSEFKSRLRGLESAVFTNTILEDWDNPNLTYPTKIFPSRPTQKQEYKRNPITSKFNDNIEYDM